MSKAEWLGLSPLTIAQAAAGQPWARAVVAEAEHIKGRSPSLDGHDPTCPYLRYERKTEEQR